MRLMSQRLLGVALVTASILALAACGGSSDSPEAKAGADEKPKVKKVSDAEREGEPAPPADFVRSRCTKCSCRVFMGDGGYCRRPACKHHWKDHQRPPQE